MRQFFTLLTLGATLGISAQTGTVKDIDGNTYKTKVYAGTEWMIENLKVSHYSDGSEIINGNLDDNNTGSVPEYVEYIGRTMQFNNNPELTKIYGRLYNHDVTEVEAGICPEGWEVPSYKDFLELVDFIMDTKYAEGNYLDSNGDFNKNSTFENVANKLKSKDLWDYNLGGTDEVEFNIMPTGFRNRYNASNFKTIEYIQMHETARIWCKEQMRVKPGYNGRMSMVITNRIQPSDKGDYSTDNMEYNSSLLYLSSSHHSEGQNIRCIKKNGNVPTSINKEESLKLAIYPNPATSYILISGADTDNGILRIYNLSGSLVKEARFTSSENKIDIEEMAAGIYVCSIESEGKTKETRKLIVQ